MDQTKKGFLQGLAYAISMVIETHGQDSVAMELLKHSGYTYADFQQAECDSHDLKPIAKALGLRVDGKRRKTKMRQYKELATITVVFPSPDDGDGESMMYEVMLHPDGSINLVRYVNNDKPLITDTINKEEYLTLEQGTLNAIALAASLIDDHFREDKRVSNNPTEILEALDRPEPTIKSF